MSDRVILVTGAGGFIGGSLVATFRRQGHTNIRAVDVKPLKQWYQKFDDVDNLQLDLNDRESCELAAKDVTDLYNLAANMGGMGFIEKNKALCMLSVLINTHLLMAARKHGVERYFYASSACVYNGDLQHTSDEGGRFTPPSLKEADAYPALAEDGYGWEKLFSERMCRHFMEDFGIYARVARFHNVYGPWGTWFGGREKAPAAICRKVIEAKLKRKHEIEIWGNGHQTRSFMYIDDCVKGIDLIMNSNILQPINLGSSEAVSINQLVDIVEDIAGIKLERRYDLSAPKGVNGRNSDNALIQSYLGWEPSISLRAGLEKTYAWIYDQYKLREEGAEGVVREFELVS
ncbi:MAG: NAD-dependent epimerase/dehydratase family protein [Terracidiphilus sp.]|jgi:nucleoside-diphosphate-sugar epimerase